MDDQIDKLSSHVLDRRLVQVVIARTSELIGKTVRESKFRTRFDAAIIALHREGNRQRRKIGDIQIAVWPCHLIMRACHAWLCSALCSSPLHAQQLISVCTGMLVNRILCLISLQQMYLRALEMHVLLP